MFDEIFKEKKTTLEKVINDNNNLICVGPKKQKVCLLYWPEN